MHDSHSSSITSRQVTLLHTISNAPPNLRPQLLEPLHNPLPIPLVHFLTHLKLPLQPLNPDLDADDILLQKLHVIDRCIGDIPGALLITPSIPHNTLLRLPRQILNLFLQVCTRFLCLGIAVHSDLAVGLHGGVVPRRDDLAGNRFGFCVEFGRHVVVVWAVEEDQHFVRELEFVISRCILFGESFHQGFCLWVLLRHVAAQDAGRDCVIVPG